MRIFDGCNVTIDFERILDHIFEVFDEVIFVDKNINRLYEIKSSGRFGILKESDNAMEVFEEFRDSVFPEDKKVFEAFNPFAGKIFSSEIRCKNNAGEYRWCYVNMIPVNGDSFFAMFIDMARSANDGIKAKNKYLKKQISADYELKVLKQKYMAILNHVQVMAVEIDLNEETISINSNLENKFLFGTNYVNTIEEFKKTDLMHEDDKGFFDSIREKLEHVRYSNMNIRVKNIDGQFFNCSMNLYGVYDNGGKLRSIIGAATEVHDADCEVKMKPEANELDSWTGLLNGLAFCKRIEKLLKSSQSEKYALIVFDIEHFKYVNEVYGLKFANDVIKYIGFNLKNMFDGTKNLTVRFLNDYFGVFVEYADDDELNDTIKNINSKITYYNDIKLKYAYGVYKVTNKLLPSRLICDYANMARKSVKGNYLDHVAFYSESMKQRIIEDINIENDMETALDERQFLMYLQPKYNIRTAKIVGAEALVRWEHPSKGIIRPNMFIPLFEKNGFIMQLDTFIWEEACRVIKKWSDNGEAPIPISVNVSRINVSNPQLVSILDSLIEKYGIEKKYLELEITETVYYDDQVSLMKTLSKLKQAGYTLLMDDFGSGFSSLSMLENTPFDVLKIDRSFFNEKMITDKGKKIIRYTIRLSNDIGLNIVAEGVETKEQADYLLQCGCCVAQGYYYSKPVTLEEFERIIGYTH